MQKIFYNGKIITNSEADEASAMLANDGSIVFVGADGVVLKLKTDDTKLVDLEGGWVYPALFDLKTNLFDKIDNKIKNAKLGRNFQISDDINENYENFANYEEYKSEFLKEQERILSCGIATIFELGLDKKSFAFWKKISEDKLLKLDVVGYVDLLDSKQVMDDNCVTYRKYKNHFRLGGYYLKMDGEIQDVKAWLTKPYAGTKNHHGVASVNGENLYFLLKTALEEKKQIIYAVNGDKSMTEILTVLSELETKEKIENFYRPVFMTSGFISKRIYEKLKHFDVSLIIKFYEETQEKQEKKFLGLFRKGQYKNLKDLIKNEIRFCCVDDCLCYQNREVLISLLNKIKRKIGSKMLKNGNFASNFASLVTKLIYLNPSYICFDDVAKGGLENQKRANFFVLDGDLFDEKSKIKFSCIEDFE